WNQSCTVRAHALPAHSPSPSWSAARPAAVGRRAGVFDVPDRRDRRDAAICPPMSGRMIGAVTDRVWILTDENGAALIVLAGKCKGYDLASYAPIEGNLTQLSV